MNKAQKKELYENITAHGNNLAGLFPAFFLPVLKISSDYILLFFMILNHNEKRKPLF
jgi:hypothetical protein